jgi:putative membrane protein
MMPSDMQPLAGDSADGGDPNEPPAPPVLPPPLPEAPLGSCLTPAEPPISTVFHGRLHPFTLLFGAVGLIKNIAIPALLLLFFGRNQFAGGLLLVLIVIPMAFVLMRYFTFTYRIADRELIIAHGVLKRTVRNIRLDRVQDIRLEQGILHRVFGMTDVHVETAGGQGPEASLSVLSRAEAERLRKAVFARIGAAQPFAPESSAAMTAPVVAREIIRRLRVRDLVLAGLTSNRAASALAVIFVVLGFLDDMMPKEQYERFVASTIQRLEQWLSQAADLQWLVFALGGVAVIFVGMIFSVMGAVVTFYGFTLSRSGEDLHRSHGLITRRASSLPRKRIQVLKIEETFLRRLLRLATLRADTAGSRGADSPEERGGRDVLLPVLPRSEVSSILPVFFPDLSVEEGSWRQVSRSAIRRATLKGVAVLLLLSAVMVTLERHWAGLWPLLFVPIIYALSVMSYRHLGYALGERYFLTRRGWLSRSTHVVPIRNAQAIVIRQTPFDRHLGVATLSVDTAGQANTGGGPKISNVAADDALAVARNLARLAADLRYL